MPAERAGYTVTMFLIDTSPSMGTLRTVDLPPGPDGEVHSKEITHLEWALQFVKLKMQEMIFNGRKTDQCGVIVIGSEETNNIINEKSGGYDNVSEYIPIGQPNAGTLAKIDALRPSTVCGDPIDALIVGIETQADYLSSKKTWTRKIVMLTDGESPIEIEDWEAIVAKMDALDVSFTIVGVDFDDEELPYEEPNKTVIKRANEEFYHKLTTALKSGLMGNLAYALQETAFPDVKQTRSTLMGTVLRLGDTDTSPDEAFEIIIKTSKCTALARPKRWKKFAPRKIDEEEMQVDQDKDKDVYATLTTRTEYYVDREGHADEDEDVKMEDEELDLLDEEQEGAEIERKRREAEKDKNLERVDREQLVRGFKYGTTYAPCPDGQFPKLRTRKGIDICGFFRQDRFRRELSMGEIQYIWADPSSPQQQVALSSIVQAMGDRGVFAIARWVSKDGMDPKMGVLVPVQFDNVDCLLWSQMPFADDVRKYTFASLDRLVSKKGEEITEHPYIPTEAQQEAMDDFVDAMDLMEAGDKDEDGNRMQWFDTRLSYNPAIHRVKQAIFHAAVVPNVETNPLPPPHPELTKYFEPPRRVLKRAKNAIEECKVSFKIKQVPKRVARARKDGHVHADDEDEPMLLLDQKGPQSESRVDVSMAPPQGTPSKPKSAQVEDGSDTEEDDDEDEDLLILDQKKPGPSAPKSFNGNNASLPTPARSLSPQVDLGRAPGRIVGTTYPLKDFQKNIAQGDVVSKAVEDLGVVVKEVLMRPFAARRSTEMLECVKALRDTCLKEDEIDAWNEFLEDLKDKCLSKPGNREFWSEIQTEGQELGLITSKEASKYGGVSSVSEKKAKEFLA